MHYDAQFSIMTPKDIKLTFLFLVTRPPNHHLQNPRENRVKGNRDLVLVIRHLEKNTQTLNLDIECL